MFRVFDPDQAVFQCQYPVKIGNVQVVVENDEAFRSRLEQKKSQLFCLEGQMCLGEWSAVEESVLSPLEV